jgi:hypothetical protein
MQEDNQIDILRDNTQVMILNNIPNYDTEDYDLYDEKDFKKYISDIERIVRSSREYRVYVQYLRQYMDMNSSVFLANVNNIETTKIKIELHHTPFTLFDIVLTIFNKRSRNQESLNVFLVAKEVAYIHYFLYVGLIPLSRTEHKLVHTQSLFIPLDLVLGRYEDFIEMYKQDIPEQTMDKYITYKEMTENYNKDKNLEVLAVRPTLLQLPDNQYVGMYSNEALQLTMQSAQSRLQALTQKSTYKLDDTQYDNNKKQLTKPFIIHKNKEDQ